MKANASYLLHCWMVSMFLGSISSFSYYVFPLQWYHWQHRREDPGSESGRPRWLPGELLQWSPIPVTATLEGVLPRLRYCARAPQLVLILGFLYSLQREIHPTRGVWGSALCRSARGDRQSGLTAQGQPSFCSWCLKPEPWYQWEDLPNALALHPDKYCC